MSEYKVTAVRTETFEIIVEAETSDEAIQVAQDTELNWNNFNLIDSEIDYTADK